MDMKAIREAAREKMKGFCRVCPICNGRVCVGEMPGMGSTGTGASFQNNMSALAAVRLNMRLIHEVKEPSLQTELLGIKLSMPILAAPIGGTSFNMGGKITEQEYASAIVSGSKAEGVIGCTGDGVPPVIYTSGYTAIREAGGWGIPFIKPWDGKEFDDKLAEAATLGCTVFGTDIDAVGMPTLAKMGRPVSPKSPAELKTIVDKVHHAGMRFIAKGILTPEDALAAYHAGCDAIVVSNHGGRVFDHAAGSAEVLPEIAAAVKGRLSILADGGVRDGSDVLKMLALGADAVLVGRPFVVAAVGGLQEGVQQLLALFREQLTQAMTQTGCASVQEAGMHLIRPGK